MPRFNTHFYKTNVPIHVLLFSKLQFSRFITENYYKWLLKYTLYKYYSWKLKKKGSIQCNLELQPLRTLQSPALTFMHDFASITLKCQRFLSTQLWFRAALLNVYVLVVFLKCSPDIREHRYKKIYCKIVSLYNICNATNTIYLGQRIWKFISCWTSILVELK